MDTFSPPGRRARGGSDVKPSNPSKLDQAPSVVGPGESRKEDQSSDSDLRSVADSLTSDVMEAAKSTVTVVKQQAAEFATDIGNELSKTAEAQKSRGVEAMQSFVRAFSNAATELDGQSPMIAQSVRQAAQKVGDLSDNISKRNVDELVKAAADLARSQPMLFVGGAVAAGFALSRFLKSSGGLKNNVGSQNAGGTHSAGGTQTARTQPARTQADMSHRAMSPHNPSTSGASPSGASPSGASPSGASPSGASTSGASTSAPNVNTSKHR